MAYRIYQQVYNAHPCIMHTPILKPVFRRKKNVSTSFLTKNNFLEKFSRNVNSSSTCTCTKISYRSWCKSFNVLSDQWYIKFYDVFFISSAVLLLHDRMRSIGTTPVAFSGMRGPRTRLVGHVTSSRWHCGEYFHDLFSQIFLHLFKKTKR